MNKNAAWYQSIRKVYYGMKELPYNIRVAADTYSIKKFKNIHKGETCFIVGNGPSMKVEDLDRIHQLGIKSFACNKIYKIFPETIWRPEYYLSSDDKIIEQLDVKKIGIPAEHMFFPRIYKDKIKMGNFYELLSYRWLEEGKFSQDAHKGIYQCGTIVAEAMQFAFYMGFSTVYIIGVDFNYFFKSQDESHQTYRYNGENNYFIKDYLMPGEVANIPDKAANILGFEAARKGFELENRHIYNATRGGLLEVFERKNLDQVFEELQYHMEKSVSV